MVYVFLANGCEEIEALAPVDMLRRGGVEVTTVGVTGKTVTGSHNISVNTDISLEEVNLNDIEAIVLPGGMPGTLNLEKNEKVQEIVEYAYDKKLLICAICAAPSILGHKGYLKDKKATWFPGFEDSFDGGEYTGEVVTTCGNIITGKGCGAGIYFGLEILKNVKDKETMKKVFDSLQCPN